VGFDGYLMNFECDIAEPEVLLQWVGRLRDRLHVEIPHSMLIWYDSVLHNGTLKWQSELNDNNYRFMSVSDAFFTDYHWNLTSLNNTKVNMEKYYPERTQFDVFYGNDIYGRGTYGGGKFNVSTAVDAIMDYDFSIALFGNAYFYESMGGFIDQNIQTMYEQIFWEGRNMDMVADDTGLRISDE